MAKLTLMHIFALFLLLAGIFITSEAKGDASPRGTHYERFSVGGCIPKKCQNDCVRTHQPKGRTGIEGICVKTENKTIDCWCGYDMF
ncbi:unnamed protein product [Lupinus luteus]|uniref:Uncharacterized protein n=1 Tax=Lupinus luteus TaxID=3873 RepID=A0AAV1W0L8_LUPLU